MDALDVDEDGQYILNLSPGSEKGPPLCLILSFSRLLKVIVAEVGDSAGRVWVRDGIEIYTEPEKTRELKDMLNDPAKHERLSIAVDGAAEEGSTLRFSIKKIAEKGKKPLIREQTLELAPQPLVELATALRTAAVVDKLRAERKLKVEDENVKLRDMHTTWEAMAEDAIKAKDAWQNDMIDKFVRVLNAKKDRIRDLQQRLGEVQEDEDETTDDEKSEKELDESAMDVDEEEEESKGSKKRAKAVKKEKETKGTSKRGLKRVKEEQQDDSGGGGGGGGVAKGKKPVARKGGGGGASSLPTSAAGRRGKSSSAAAAFSQSRSFLDPLPDVRYMDASELLSGSYAKKGAGSGDHQEEEEEEETMSAIAAMAESPTKNKQAPKNHRGSASSSSSSKGRGEGGGGKSTSGFEAGSSSSSSSSPSPPRSHQKKPDSSPTPAHSANIPTGKKEETKQKSIFADSSSDEDGW